MTALLDPRPGTGHPLPEGLAEGPGRGAPVLDRMQLGVRGGLATALRHPNCAAQGCQRPHAWCELHHKKPSAHGGRTDLADAVPLCHHHHQHIHDPGFTHHHLPDDTIRFSRRT